MNNLSIQKIEARLEADKQWRMTNEETGKYLEVTFSHALENKMKEKRNFSFNRFESEQLNNLSKLAAGLKENGRLTLDSTNIGLDFMPLSSKMAAPLIQSVH